MTSTSQKWLLGCGVGCAVLVLALVGLITGGVVYVRGKFQTLEQAAENRNKLVSALGTPESYIPPLNGTIPPEKMEAFLFVRAQLKEAQARLDSAISSFDFDRLNRKQSSLGEVLGLLNDLSSLISPFGEYLGKRNQALLDRKMPLGEYLYIYSLAYHSWLGHNPEEGPPALSRVQKGGDSSFSPEIVRGQYRRLFLRLLENQMRNIPESDQSDLRKNLRNEIDRLGADLGYVVWRDGLPPAIEASLEPHRSRLESLYHRSTNCFELLQLDERSRQVRWTPAEKEPETEVGQEPVKAEIEPAVAPSSNSTVQITYSVAGGVLAPVPEKQTVPPYTAEARKAGIEGTLELQGIIRKDGSIDRVRIVRGLGHGLDESALRLITSEWRFRPGTLNGSPVDVRATIEIRFSVR
jgi:TonB family protein